MTGRFHILTKPPQHPRHRRCLKLLGRDDTLVLAEAALHLLTEAAPNDLNAGCVIALGDASEVPSLPDGVTHMNHTMFVDQILTQHQPVFW